MSYNPINAAGEIQEADFRRWFTYRPTSDRWALAHGLSVEIDVGDQIRFGNVLKTVAYVCTDETETGAPVIEKWKLSNHHFFG